ncbi:hypothetical protein BJ875DRAFT_387224, partial [Amylocarpus encephaloides]
RTRKLSFQQLARYDDILTGILVDRVSFSPLVTLKVNTSYQSISSEDQQSVISTLQDFIKGKAELKSSSTSLGSDEEKVAFDLPGLKSFSASLGSADEKVAFFRHMKQYLEMHLPDCPFEFSSTLRYTRTTYEAAITARQFIPKGKDIKYLCGTRAILTELEKKGLGDIYNDFSIIETSRNQATSFLGGPVRFTNHDCKPNARLTSFGISGIKIVAIRDIEIGEEITVSYAKDYFEGECLCKTCEGGMKNGWRQGPQYSRTPGDYCTESLHPGNHLQGHGASSLLCLACEHHKNIYRFCWPKTRQESRTTHRKRARRC